MLKIEDGMITGNGDAYELLGDYAVLGEAVLRKIEEVMPVEVAEYLFKNMNEAVVRESRRDKSRSIEEIDDTKPEKTAMEMFAEILGVKRPQ